MVTKGFELPMHEHRKAQLVLTPRGIVRCEADQGVWIVPPRCAVWIPGNVLHSVTVAGDVEVYCLFVEPDAAPSLPRHCCTLSVSPLLDHLLQYVARMPILYDVDGADGRIATVLLDQLSSAPVEKLNFPMPADGKLRKIAAAMMKDPSDRATIDDRARRMAIALQSLGQGTSVKTIALDLGYEGASAFVTMFRKALGKPPARYLAERGI